MNKIIISFSLVFMALFNLDAQITGFKIRNEIPVKPIGIERSEKDTSHNMDTSYDSYLPYFEKVDVGRKNKKSVYKYSTPILMIKLLNKEKTAKQTKLAELRKELYDESGRDTNVIKSKFKQIDVLNHELQIIKKKQDS